MSQLCFSILFVLFKATEWPEVRIKSVREKINKCGGFTVSDQSNSAMSTLELKSWRQYFEVPFHGIVSGRLSSNWLDYFWWTKRAVLFTRLLEPMGWCSYSERASGPSSQISVSHLNPRGLVWTEFVAASMVLAEVVVMISFTATIQVLLQTVCSRVCPLRNCLCGVLLAANCLSSLQRSLPIQHSWPWILFTWSL